ncbi:uncharacterized protein ACA1_251490 [Acanthamoeba castellanii str. Neff]|uniref:Uncharacterized protein n=1 Tax=Acanthamoeba castellanii (strain ATCC 30010 / Neff) TaxID=1257118 RepID=L8HAJ7_ACACF|nr:uncharacterized protein ACA1_251490 [Acanthamoeba castellanii str. Neff]ELR22267.1 hypothetical protein ACA1_251490 [Acanthamoeba castellanii str. Neff]
MASTSVGGAHQHAVGERQSPYSTTPIITTNAKCPTTYTKSYWAINGSLSYLLGSWSSIGSFSVVNKTMGVIMQMLKVNNTSDYFDHYLQGTSVTCTHQTETGSFVSNMMGSRSKARCCEMVGDFHGI